MYTISNSSTNFNAGGAITANTGGFWARLGQRLRRPEPSRDDSGALVTVWDARQGRYRQVDLLDRHDPLWFAAQALAAAQATMPSRFAA